MRTMVTVECPECSTAFQYPRGYKRKYCSQTCANRNHGRDRGIQTNKVKAMKNSAQAQGKSWPTATEEWSKKIAPHRKGSRKHWSNDQIKLIDSDFDELIEEHRESKITLTKLAKKHGFSHSLLIKHFARRGIAPETFKWRSTQPEREIRKMLERIGVHAIINERELLNGKELDFFIPSKSVAIEINGLYWHSEELRQDKDSHVRKHNTCLTKQIKLLQFWDCEINEKPRIIESLIRHHLGVTNTRVYARTTKVVEINSAVSKPFFDENHIQGDVNASVRLALQYKGQIVSVMTFSRARFGEHEWEMTRFCSLINTSVIGGAAKLFSAFIHSHNPKSIVTYADRRLFDGKVYKQLGFKHSHNVKRTYWYFNEAEYWPHHRMRFQRKHLSKRLNSFNPSLTEHQNMMNNGWYRVWDCGQSVWVWTL